MGEREPKQMREEVDKRLRTRKDGKELRGRLMESISSNDSVLGYIDSVEKFILDYFDKMTESMVDDSAIRGFRERDRLELVGDLERAKTEADRILLRTPLDNARYIEVIRAYLLRVSRSYILYRDKNITRELETKIATWERLKE